MAWDKVPDNRTIEQTAEALRGNGFATAVVNDGQAAKQSVLASLTKKASVMTVTSTTADQIGLTKAINGSDDYASIRRRIEALPESEQRTQMRRLTASADFVVGSVHAVTRAGEVVIASNSGSQLPLSAFSAAKVIWVVGAQKIVDDLDGAFRRIEEYAFKLENERMQKTYGMPSGINKLLVMKKEIVPDRVSVVLVKEKLGF